MSANQYAPELIPGQEKYALDPELDMHHTSGMPKTEIIHDARIMLKMPSELLARLQSEAGRGQVNAAVREAIQAWLKKQERKR